MKEKLWTKDFIGITSVNFFLMLTFYLLMVTISAYSAEKFASNESAAGLASSIFVIGALVGRLFGGKYLEIIGRKKLLLAGMVLIIISSILYFLTGSYSILIAVRLLHGFAFGVAGTATGTIVAQAIPHTRRGEGIGYFALSMTIATAIGPFIGIFILEHFHFSMIFVFCLVCAVISSFISLILKVQEITISKENLAEMKGFKLSNFIERKSVPITLAATVTAFCYAGIISFLTFFAAEKGITEAAGFFFVVYAAAVLATRPVTGRLFDTKGPNFVMYPSIISFIIGMFILSQASSGVILLISGAFIGFGYGTYMSSSQAVAIKEAPAHRVGLATATFFILTDIGLGIVPFLQGYIVPSLGYNGLFILLAILLIICLPLHYFLYGKNASAVVNENASTAKLEETV
ncbi:MFS transporter [Neobacillus mesonae]|uniref:MFS transporter n=1 Tax=Neobacillus mesonae TaxID=1193713 RepID=UPI00203EE50A|nr:MFS transporter [Neobacillus mesonae]MCM3570279.1 MFS transporter [Neobacillus mesonae]